MADAVLQWRASTGAESKIPPVLLFTGPAGIGKRSAALYLAQWLLCERAGFSSAGPTDASNPANDTQDLFGGLPISTTLPQPDAERALDAPCGECASCRRAHAETWLDLLEIGPGSGDSAESSESRNASIKIEQFRDMKSSLGFGAHAGAFRIILIRDAEAMTAQAANSLLKILEEPPNGWLFFLTASDASLLLPTLLSRCQKLRLQPLPSETLERILKEEKSIAPERARISARLAQGSLRKAMQFAEDETWEKRQEIFKFLALPQSQLTRMIEWASAEHRNFETLLDTLECVLNDLFSYSISSDHSWLNSDGKTALLKHAVAITQKHGSARDARNHWERCAKAAARARALLRAPLNRKLLAQDLLTPWI